ncbi:hypothetical protein AC578_7782 [Pseudocercospora eumusae]|uniref:MYND-type domain-containing protein n=1 Tax=Pseudocercospora eumusae TaxID=321146 RepID=A0A139H125_9PEZI|nr:hypothetical protein AC578_7782 [Pseudocercospora eumusae]
MTTLQARPVQLLTASSIHAKITAIVSLLLDVFIRGSQDSAGIQQSPSFAPWSWAMSGDEEIEAAIQPKLRECGVHDDLCTVGLCTREEKDIIDRQWSRLFARTAVQTGEFPRWLNTSTSARQLGDASHCHHCRSSMSTWLKRCSDCRGAYYCSQRCQEEAWQRHKERDCAAMRFYSFSFGN